MEVVSDEVAAEFLPFYEHVAVTLIYSESDKKSAGKDWVKGFLHRNRELTFRSPEPTSIAFNATQAGRCCCQEGSKTTAGAARTSSAPAVLSSAR